MFEDQEEEDSMAGRWGMRERGRRGGGKGGLGGPTEEQLLFRAQWEAKQETDGI